MVRVFYTFIFLVANSILISAQNSRFVYEVSQKDVTKDFFLDFDSKNKISFFYEDNINSNKRNIGTEFIIEKKNDSIYSYDNFEKFQFTSESIIFNWKLIDESKIYKNMNIQKAEVVIFGRKWIAWFTKDIPSNDGPYKFSGLPGLIVSISDEENIYNFNLIEILKLRKMTNLNIEDAKKINQAEFIKKKFFFDNQTVLFNEINSQNNIITPEDRKFILNEMERAKKQNVLFGIE